MQLQDGIQFLSNLQLVMDTPMHWADLGCGSGFFTEVLAQLLPGGSNIDAVDMHPQDMPAIMGNKVNIRFHQLDFTTQSLPSTSLDGILVANALHYAKDKTAVIQKLKHHLNPNGVLVIIEYDSLRANPWVPYPIDYASLQRLSITEGFKSIKKIGERPSAYHSGGMYAAVLD